MEEQLSLAGMVIAAISILGMRKVCEIDIQGMNRTRCR